MPSSKVPTFRRLNLLNRAVAIGCAGLVSATVSASGPPIASWDATWQAAENEWALADLTVIGPAGETYVSTRPQSGGGNGSGLLKYDTAGQLEWSIVLEEVPDGSEGFTDLEITPEGISMVGTSRDSEGAPQTLLLNYAADGTFLWEARTIGPVIAGFLAPQLAIGPAGERVIATDDGNGAGTLERYDAAGILLSATPLSFMGFGGVSALELDGAGNAIVVSLSNFSAYLIEAYDAAGNRLWFYEDAADGLALSEAVIAIAENGDVVATGSLEIVSKGELRVISRVWRLDSNGVLQWTHDSDQDFAVSRDLVLGDDDATYVIRSTTFPTSELARIDAAGNQSWARSFSEEGFLTAFLHLGISASGDVIVGASDSADSNAFAARVLSYSPEGDLNWTARVLEEAGHVFFIGDLNTDDNGNVALAITKRADPIFDLALTVHLQFAACDGDLDGLNGVGFGDLIILLSAWGPQVDHPADFDQDGEVGFADLLTLLAAWGPCG